MSQPVRVICDGVTQIPPVEELVRLTTRSQHVVLEFPVGGERAWQAFDVAAVIAALAPRVPEDIVVFDSGGSAVARSVTLKRVLDRATILRHAATIHEAALAFRQLATRLIFELLPTLELPPDSHSTALLLLRRLANRAPGSIDGGWDYVFHGLECRFEHRETRQVVDVRLSYDGELGVLDPAFLIEFMSTTPRFAALARIFEYGDMARALDVLAESGLLRLVRSTIAGCGYVAVDRESPR